MGTVLGIETPTLVINADDDPVCAPSNVDDNVFCFDGADTSRALVRTPIGTHCCFYEGRTLVPRNSWAHVAALDFFQAVAEEK
jgi:predicted alpha/beta-fold hydrolase